MKSASQEQASKQASKPYGSVPTIKTKTCSKPLISRIRDNQLKYTMTHLAMKKLVVLSLVAAPVLAGKSSSKTNKVTMSISEIEREMPIPLHEGGSKSSKAAVSHSPSSSHAPSSAETGAAAEGVTSNGKSGKSDRSKGGKPSDSMSMPDNALSTPLHNGGKSGKVVTAFGKSDKADAKAFKGKSSESFVDSKSLKSSKGSKNMSLSVAYDESAMPSSAPSTFPSFAAIVGEHH
jgi:hypothetical protein